MGGGNVKITILERLLQSIAPDLCYFCGKVGGVFCTYCKYDITCDVPSVCYRCDEPARDGVCGHHAMDIQLVRSVGLYEGGLKNALQGLKFQRDAFSVRILAEMLNDIVPVLPSDTVVIPVPTRRGAVRKRGYDHVLVMAKRIAASQGLDLYTDIRRAGGVIQHNIETRKEREQQIKGVFYLQRSPRLLSKTALIVDDVITTGATLREIATVLRKAGVENIYAVALARTP